MREIETPTRGPSWGGAFFVVPSDICLLFYVCANPPSGDLSGAALEVPSEALLHPRSYFRIMQPILQFAHIISKNG